MGNFNELSSAKQWGILALVGIVLTVALYFTVFNSKSAENASSQKALDAKLQENAELEKYRTKLDDIERQLASLKQQLEIERHIVPDEKEAPQFMEMMQSEARKAGIEIRRYEALNTTQKEFFTEVPWSIDMFLLGGIT